MKALLKQFWSEKLRGNSACCSEGALKRRLCISSDASLVRDEFFQHGVNKYSHSSQYLTPSLFCTRRSKARKTEEKNGNARRFCRRGRPPWLCRADLTTSLYLFSLSSSEANDARRALPGAPSRCQPPTPLGGAFPPRSPASPVMRWKGVSAHGPVGRQESAGESDAA